ncbi:MAG TPA: DUF58 domain-containing protein, partial [Chloroflexota bacterium]
MHEYSRLTTLPRRGLYTVASGAVRVRDPFGLIARTHSHLDGARVIVYPRPLAVDEAVQAARAVTSSRQSHRTDYGDSTLGDLRAYREGDPLSRVHWRTTARTGRLVVTAPEPRGASSTWLLVDLGGEGDLPETAASIAAFVVETLSRSAASLGAIVAGDELDIVPPEVGPVAAATILEALARVRSSPEPQVDRILRSTARVAPGSNCILISASDRSHAYTQNLERVCRQSR